MKSLVILLVLIGLLPQAIAIDTVASGYRVVDTTTVKIDAAGKCRDVNNAAGKDIFIGTRTQGEWWSFIASPPTNVTPTTCSITSQYTTSVHKVMPSASLGVTVTESGTAWTSSAWVQVTAATANAIILTGVMIDMPSSSTSDFEVDIGTGAAGSETVVATLSGVRKTNASGPWWLKTPIPIDNVASGARVAVRIRADNTSATNTVMTVTYFDKPVAGTILTTSAAAQVMPSAAAGTSVTPSATGWANSNWFQVTASTATAIVLGGISVFGGTNEEFEVDVGVGAAGSETVVTTFRDNITNGNGGPYVTLLNPPLDNIPSGSRVAIRMRKNGTNVTAWRIKLMYYSAPTGLTLPTLPLKWSTAGANSTGVTPSGVAWTDGAWATLIASAPAHLQLAGFQMDPRATSQYEVDFGVGAAGSEVVIASFKGMCSNTGLEKYYIPFAPLLNAVPLGARLAARIRISGTSTTNWGISVGYYEDATSFDQASAYRKITGSGANAVTVTSSGTSWGNSAWVQYTAGVSNPILISSISYDPTTAEPFEVDIGTGAAGAETVVSTFSGNVANSNGNQIIFLPAPLLVAANTRVAIRMRKNGTAVSACGYALNYVEFQ